MTNDLRNLVAGSIPDSTPPFGDVLKRRDRRRTHRRMAVAGAVAAAAVVTGVGVAVGTSDGPDVGDAPTATDPTSRASTSSEQYPDGTWDGGGPPPLVLQGPAGPVEARQGSFCWGMGCGDMVTPRASELPDVGAVSSVTALFPLPGQWSVSVSEGTGSGGCASYPVLVEPGAGAVLELTPAGAAGDRVGSYFVYAGGGDTSGWWRWTVPERDGVPLAWVSLTQNSPRSGGMAQLRVIVDDAAVDGAVSATVRVTSADGGSTTVETPQVDQHCDEDGFVELGTGNGLRERVIDRLGPRPYAYQVDLTIDGETYVGTGTLPEEGELHGGDARITFDPPLPTPD